MMKWLYNLMYRYSFVSIPWDIGPRAELVRLVESGRIQPCRAIDLGSGTASNVIYLAQHGFDVTGVDFTPAAIDLGRERARQAGVEVEFIQDDLTDLQHTDGVYDLLVDYGTLDDIAPSRRHLFVENILPLTHPDTTFVLYCFEWAPRWWVRLVENRVGVAMSEGEVEALLGEHFDIELYDHMQEEPQYALTWKVYLMKRKIKGEKS
jgi:SAM-dependent methyltransferase